MPGNATLDIVLQVFCTFFLILILLEITETALTVTLIRLLLALCNVANYARTHHRHADVHQYTSRHNAIFLKQSLQYMDKRGLHRKQIPRKKDIKRIKRTLRMCMTTSLSWFSPIVSIYFKTVRIFCASLIFYFFIYLFFFFFAFPVTFLSRFAVAFVVVSFLTHCKKYRRTSSRVAFFYFASRHLDFEWENKCSSVSYECSVENRLDGLREQSYSDVLKSTNNSNHTEQNNETVSSIPDAVSEQSLVAVV